MKDKTKANNKVANGKIQKKVQKKHNTLNVSKSDNITKDVVTKAIKENIVKPAEATQIVKQDKKQKKPKKPNTQIEGKVNGESKKNNVESKEATQAQKDVASLDQDKKDKKLMRKQKKKDAKKQKPDGPRVRDPALNASTVFVGNLPTNSKRIQIARLFENYKPVHSIRIRTANGKALFKHKVRKNAPSLIAYVVLSSVENAQKSLELNGTTFKDNHIRVTLADNKQGNDIKRTVFVGNLKYSATEEKLREIFSSCGEIDYIRCLQGDGGCNGTAYVCFKSAEAVGLALELKETLLDERPIHVERYLPKKTGAKKARDEAAASKTKVKTGAKKRLDEKKQNKQGKTAKESPQEKSNKKKKNEYRGVKIEDQKKKQKKKGKPSEMQKLAKKIAPK
ncbi:nucleolar protein 12-like [Teleopsis dalmanni]|uniref:nucleolar protein 12-like n=1 Tax=Teleopsis dalmanni TaxID=139649 RepID=UPI0018CFCD4C|nr:nucleolar protein 12-like [Teleopsis dalmanni]